MPKGKIVHMKKLAGKLIVLEGPDGVGKTTICNHLKEHFQSIGINCEVFSFPGQQEGKIGKLIYELHHNPESFGVKTISNDVLQILHIAAHVDLIKSEILPALRSKKIVILDRYLWSTIIYGQSSDMDPRLLRQLVEIENLAWDSTLPFLVVLLKCSKSFKIEQSAGDWSKLMKAYELLQKEQNNYRSFIIENNGEIGTTLNTLVKYLKGLTMTSKRRQISSSGQEGRNYSLNFEKNALKDQKTNKSSNHYIKMSKDTQGIAPAIPTKIYDKLWWLAAERQNIFIKRLKNDPHPWTIDSILNRHKFTNAYRASDRVSQYLIRNVIYQGNQSVEEVLFRILLFKFFNKIETWEVLKNSLATISYRNYDYSKYNEILLNEMNLGKRIYSPAYIMPSGKSSFGNSKKHQNHLQLLELIMKNDLANKLAKISTMKDLFLELKGYPMIGDFLAFQLAIDINYSELTSFDEMEFVVPGPGALSGISKCFSDTGGLSAEDIINRMAQIQDREFERLGIEFNDLWGRPLQLIDIQNLFCEIDKYSRVAFPELMGNSKRTRIKQIFKENQTPIDIWYPPKWKLNDRILDWKDMHYDSD